MLYFFGGGDDMITLNGNEIAYQPQTLRELLTQQGFVLSYVVVERNGRIVRGDALAQEPLEDGDVLEVVSFVGGG